MTVRGAGGRDRAGIACGAVLLAAVLLGPLGGAAPAWGQAAGSGTPWQERPERGISLYTDYSRVEVDQGEAVRMDLTIDNRGRRNENVGLKLGPPPKGWKVSLRGGGFDVGGVPVAAGKTRTLTFQAEPDKGMALGTYDFRIDGVTSDGQLSVSQPVSVTVREKRGSGAGELQISTSYPVLRGQSDARFEFSLEVTNKHDRDRTVNLTAQVPERWEANFKPSYEAKYISSLVIPAGQNRTVALELTPPRDATAGEYPVVVRVATGESRAETQVTVGLTGTYKLEARTPSGLLSTEAVTGQPTTVAFLVRNSGSAPNRNIGLTAFKPENWKVEFKPEKIEELAPGAFQQVEATIVPGAQALVGDYSVGLTASGERTNASVEMRVTVKAPTAWGWIGVALIVAVVGGLGGLFAWFGRR